MTHIASHSDAQSSVTRAPKASTNVWQKWMDFDLGIIPLPIYVLLIALLAAFTWLGTIKSDIATVIGIMAAFAFTLGELGQALADYQKYRWRGGCRHIRAIVSRLSRLDSPHK